MNLKCLQHSSRKSLAPQIKSEHVNIHTREPSYTAELGVRTWNGVVIAMLKVDIFVQFR